MTCRRVLDTVGVLTTVDDCVERVVLGPQFIFFFFLAAFLKLSALTPLLQLSEKSRTFNETFEKAALPIHDDAFQRT
jgi:hypothetical protein